MKTLMNQETNEYLDFLADWLTGLESVHLSEAEVSPAQIALMVVDITNGFCNQGPLASERVKAIIDPITRLMKQAWNAGVRNFFLLNDTHEPDAIEFKSYPPHCIRGTIEAQPVAEIRSLDFFNQIVLVEKNSISTDIHTTLEEHLEHLKDITHFIVTGDCTDLCVYQLAMYLRLEANACQDNRREVIIPVDCVDTYDMGIEATRKFNAVPHPGDLLHAIFLHHMQLNGIKVVQRVEF